MKKPDECMRNRVVSYWTGRAETFGEIRKKELHDEIGQRWDQALVEAMGFTDAADLTGLRVLDVGTGTGQFAILLAKHGCRVTGIDLTPAMIEEARRQAEQEGVEITFEVMDAQAPDFPPESFDCVVSKNLTWTLPDAEKAYASWHRVLRTGGRLVNFDANYAAALRAEEKDTSEEFSEDAAEGAAECPEAQKVTYGHAGVTEEQRIRNREITLSMNIGRKTRPDWDLAILRKLGFQTCAADTSAGERILRDKSDPSAPIFLIRAMK